MSTTADDLAVLRAEIARKARDARRTPSDESAREALERLRAQYATKKIENYVKEVVAAAPPLSDHQRDTLSRLVNGIGGAR